MLKRIQSYLYVLFNGENDERAKRKRALYIFRNMFAIAISVMFVYSFVVTAMNGDLNYSNAVGTFIIPYILFSFIVSEIQSMDEFYLCVLVSAVGVLFFHNIDYSFWASLVNLIVAVVCTARVKGAPSEAKKLYYDSYVVIDGDIYNSVKSDDYSIIINEHLNIISSLSFEIKTNRELMECASRKSKAVSRQLDRLKRSLSSCYESACCLDKKERESVCKSLALLMKVNYSQMLIFEDFLSSADDATWKLIGNDEIEKIAVIVRTTLADIYTITTLIEDAKRIEVDKAFGLTVEDN